MIKKRWLIPGLGVLLLALGVGGGYLWNQRSAPLLPFKIKCPVPSEYCQEAILIQIGGSRTIVGVVVPEGTPITIPFDGYIEVTRFPSGLIAPRLVSESDASEAVALDLSFLGELKYQGMRGAVKEGLTLGYAGKAFEDTDYAEYGGANLLLEAAWKGSGVNDFREYLE